MPHLSDDEIAQCLRHIHERCPDLVIDSVRVQAAGQHSAVLLINNTLVCRFPRTQVGSHALAVEVAILRALAGRLPLPIPSPQVVHLAAGAADRAFVGYPRLPGSPLRRESLLRLDGTTQRALAGQLGGFLYALHTTASEVLPTNLPVQDGHDRWVDFYARVRARLFGSMRPEARRGVERHFETYLSAATHTFAFRPVLRHGDLAQPTSCTTRQPAPLAASSTLAAPGRVTRRPTSLAC